LSRDSILIYSLQRCRRTRASRAEWIVGDRVARLRTPREVEQYVA
jgi:hypothetical protein